MWEALRSLTLKGGNVNSQDEKGGDDLTSESAAESQPTAEEEPKSKICHFLRLPIEIRLQIYAYTDIGGHIIEVLNHPIIHTSQGVQCFRTYSTNPVDHELVYRLECPDDAESSKPSPNGTPRKSSYKRGYTSSPFVCTMPFPRQGQSSSTNPAKQRRCFSVHGLFGLTSVCRQIRADTQELVFELNAFAFTDKNYNYSSAIRAFSSSLSQRELAAVHTIYWPLVNILVIRQSLHCVKLEEPDWNCAEELGALKGLEKVVLRHFGSEFHSATLRYSEVEAQELKAVLAEPGVERYTGERQYRRMLAVRTMKALVASKDVEVHCERSWRANF